MIRGFHFLDPLGGLGTDKHAGPRSQFFAFFFAALAASRSGSSITRRRRGAGLSVVLSFLLPVPVSSLCNLVIGLPLGARVLPLVPLVIDRPSPRLSCGAAPPGGRPGRPLGFRVQDLSNPLSWHYSPLPQVNHPPKMVP